MVFRWRNLDELVELSKDQRKVDRAEHDEWFKAALKNRDKMLFVIGPDAGFGRLERRHLKAHISLYILPKFQGQGWGAEAIHRMTQEGLKRWPIKEIIAEIRADNRRSKAVFNKVGYRVEGGEENGMRRYVHR